MDIVLTNTLSLSAVLALIMINFASRRIATAQAIRNLMHDSVKGTHHFKQDKTMLALRSRLSFQASMLALTSLGTLLALTSTLFVVIELDSLSKSVFVAAIVSGMLGMLQSLRESLLANKAHFGELDATISKHDPYYKSDAA
jgi:hypothetical protein